MFSKKGMYASQQSVHSRILRKGFSEPFENIPGRKYPEEDDFDLLPMRIVPLLGS